MRTVLPPSTQLAAVAARLRDAARSGDVAALRAARMDLLAPCRAHPSAVDEALDRLAGTGPLLDLVVCARALDLARQRLEQRGAPSETLAEADRHLRAQLDRIAERSERLCAHLADAGVAAAEPTRLQPRFTTVGPVGDRLRVKLELANLPHVRDAYGPDVTYVLLALVGARLRHLQVAFPTQVDGTLLVLSSSGMPRDDWERLVDVLGPMEFDHETCARLVGIDRREQVPPSVLRGRAVAVPDDFPPPEPRPVPPRPVPGELDTSGGLLSAQLAPAEPPPDGATVAAIREHLDGLGLGAVVRVDERTWVGPAAGWTGPDPLYTMVLRPVVHDVPVADDTRTVGLLLEAWPLAPARPGWSVHTQPARPAPGTSRPRRPDTGQAGPGPTRLHRDPRT